MSSGDDENPSTDSEKVFSSSSEDEKSEDEEEKVSKSPESLKKKSPPEDDKKSEKPLQVSSPPKEVKKYKDSVPNEQKKLIKEIFLLEMPEDFYQFYEFCCSLSSTAPGSALKAVGLELVGPFDVLLGKIKTVEEDEKYLRHWRYFYDPPELQVGLLRMFSYFQPATVVDYF